MRWYPIALFLFLFWLPNHLGWVASPNLDYWAMLSVAILFFVAYPCRRSCGWETTTGRIDFAVAPTVTARTLLLLLPPSILVLPYSAVLHSIVSGGFSPEIREQSLKLAPSFVPLIVNIMRDAVIPYLIIATTRSGQFWLRSILWVWFVFFATFNLAKSFLIINTLAIFMALFRSPLIMAASATVVMVPVLVLLARLYVGADVNVQAFLFDFLVRRILTLTPELGVNVREFVIANGFYWGSSLPRDFEYELFSFIQHSNLESGWANVYAMADAFGRGGPMGVAVAFIIIAGYLSFFWLFVRSISSGYAIYLWALFCTYVFMQGVFSLGLLVSFLIGAGATLIFRGTLLGYYFIGMKQEKSDELTEIASPR